MVELAQKKDLNIKYDKQTTTSIDDLLDSASVKQGVKCKTYCFKKDFHFDIQNCRKPKKLLQELSQKYRKPFLKSNRSNS